MTTLLCILDGWGIDKDNADNSITRANLEHYNRILKTYPHSKLETSGLAVGLPEGQMGNSEVGHMTIGSGRVIFQDFPRINNAIAQGSLVKNEKLIKLANDLKESQKTCHIMGLLSDGGVHSHMDHMIFVAKFLQENGVKVLFHAFLDGRDVAQKSAINYLKKLENIEVATICGRHYAMDRDQNWDRIKPAYDAMVLGSSQHNSPTAISAIEESYENAITDEFAKPYVINNYAGIQDGDALISCNFRADRIRQISQCILDETFNEFATQKINFSHKLAMTKYSDSLAQIYDILFPKIDVKNSLPEILAHNSSTQLRIAETEKYAHVTFFFSGGREANFPGEERILVKSPNVTTYDLQPEMSALQVGEKLGEAIKSQKFDFIVVNYANPDMVGHSGNLEASIQACKVIDQQLAMLEKLILEQNGKMLISADHGNIEDMVDDNDQPHTSHTTNPVPLILIGKDVDNIKLDDGKLSDIAPTILHLMNIAQPTEMSGNNLIKND